MIYFPDDLKQYNIRQHDGFLGELTYNLNSVSPFTLQYEEKIPHNYFPKQILPKPRLLYRDFLHVIEDGKSFLVSEKRKIFNVYGPETYSFKTSAPIKQIKTLKDQIFLQSENFIFSANAEFVQSLAIPSVDIDVSELTKEVFILSNDRIEIINGTSYQIACHRAHKLILLDNPREVLVFTKNDGYHVDLRQKKIIKRIFTAKEVILDVQKQKNKIVVATGGGLTVIKDFSYDFTDTVYLHDGHHIRMVTVHDEVLLYKFNNFTFYDINNLMRRENVRYDINNFLGVTGHKDAFYFFSSNGVAAFDTNGKGYFYKIKIEPSLANFPKSKFLRFKHHHSRAKDIRKYEYLDQDVDIKCDLYDSILEEIDDYKKVQAENNPLPSIISDVKKKQKKNSGF